MDPALVELFEEGAPDDEVSVIIRLRPGSAVPPGVRVIARFGRPEPRIVTARCRRGDLRVIRGRREVASMKAPGRVVRIEPYTHEDAESADHETAVPLPGDQLLPEDGSGVVAALIDYGFDFTHANFRNPDGTTRLKLLWDQGAAGGEAPAPYGYGRLWTRRQIDFALTTPDPAATLGYHPSRGDTLGRGSHGTHVADIFAGNRREPGSRVGLARASEIVFVQLAGFRAGPLDNFGDSVQLLEALDFVRNQAGERPLVINLSAGKTGGPHNGTELFSQAVDALLIERPGIALSQSVGNYAESRMASHGRLGPARRRALHWLVSPGDRTPNELEIWYSGLDRFDVTLMTPDGARYRVPLGGRLKVLADGARLGTLYHRRREPNSGMNHIEVLLNAAAPHGRYRIELTGLDVVDGRYFAWIERDAPGSHQSRFPRREASSRYTVNTICNSLRGIAVGAYDAQRPNRPPALFSSRGLTADGRQKPELVAPGVRIRAARSLPLGGWDRQPRFTVKSGTSMASPWVAGTMALMLQAAGRPLTNEELRALLIGSLDRVPGGAGHSHTRLGYGYLNVAAAVEAARAFGRRRAPSGARGDDRRAGGAGGEPAAHADPPDWMPRWLPDTQPFWPGDDRETADAPTGVHAGLPEPPDGGAGTPDPSADDGEEPGS